MFRLLTIIGFCTLFIIPIAGFASNIVKNEALLIALTFALGYIALPAMLLQLWPAAKVNSLDKAMASGNVVTTDVAAVRLVELEDGSEGMFLAETADGRTLCLATEPLIDLVAKGRFPTLRFRTFTHRETQELYGVEPVGEPLETWVVYDQVSESLLGATDGHFVGQPIDRLLQHIGGREARVARRGRAA